MLHSCSPWRYGRVLWLSLSVLAHAVGAVEVPDLLTARIAVADQSAHTRQPILAQGLGQVLVKVSGNTRAAALASQMPTERIQGLLGRFSYAPSSGGDNALPLRLELTFTQAGITQLLASSGLAAWDNDRPLTLLWMGLDDGTRRVLAEDDPLARSAREFAALRGLPLITPLMDLREQGLVSPGALWLNDLDRLEPISANYRPDLVGVLFLYRDPAGWRARLTTRVDGQVRSSQSSGSSPGQVLEAAINTLADQVRDLYGPAALTGPGPGNPVAADASPPDSTPRSGLRLVVRGGASPADFDQLYAYLLSLDGIGRVTPAEITDAEIVFRLDYNGDPQAIRRRLALDNRLLPVEPASTQDAQGHYRELSLVYRLLPRESPPSTTPLE